YGLNTARAKFFNRGADKIDNRCRSGNFLASPKLRELATNEIDNQRSRQINRAECFQDRRDSWNLAPAARFHFVVHINFFLRRTMRPMTAAEGVPYFFSAAETFLSERSGTQRSSPPLVCASESNVRWIDDVFAKSTV